MSEQTTLDQLWKFVDEQKARNKSFRLNWKQILGGISLSKCVAQLKGKGLTVDDAMQHIISVYGIKGDELLRRLKIGVFSRWGEMNTEIQAYEKARVMNGEQRKTVA